MATTKKPIMSEARFVGPQSVKPVLEQIQSLIEAGAVQGWDLQMAAEALGIDALKPGPVEVWYAKSSCPSKWRNPAGWYCDGNTPDLDHLDETHVLMGKVKSKQLDEVWGSLQGEVWSPNGEANGFIRKSGTDHTSMDVGDIIVVGNTPWMVDGSGFWDMTSTYRHGCK